MLVNTGAAQMSDKVLAALNQLANAARRRRRRPNSCFGANCPGAWGWSSPYINTVISSPAPAAAAALHRQHQRRAGARRRQREDRHVGLLPARRRLRRAPSPSVGRRASIVAHENVLNRMSAPGGKQPPAAGGRAADRHVSSTSSTSCPRISTAKR